jgi:GTP cyclohydrolase II
MTKPHTSEKNMFNSSHRIPQVEERARASIPTRFGEFQTVVFHDSSNNGFELSAEPVALIKGDVQEQEDVLVRVHSECLTSEVFGSLKCDCKEQLENAQGRIASTGQGIVIYLRQEGRGIGLANKIKAYALQSAGADTVDANRLLGLPDDARTYGVAAAILQSLGVRSIRLITNNPTKVDALRSLGVNVNARVPSLVNAGPWAANYLETKRKRMHHFLPGDSAHQNEFEELPLDSASFDAE